MTLLDTHILDDLEFAPAIPCEHRRHHDHHSGDEPASWAVISICPGCHGVARFHLCEPGRLRMATGTVGCVRCGYADDWAAFVVRCEPIGGAA